MRFKSIVGIIIFSIFIFAVNPSNVFADCSNCNPPDCESCGCVLGNNGTCVYSNVSNESSLSCGNGLIKKIPSSLPKITKTIYLIFQVAVPVLLVVLCMLDLIKAIISQKEDEIKKNQRIVIKRLISAVLIFFLFVIVKFFISIIADDNSSGIIGCASCFIEGVCK